MNCFDMYTFKIICWALIFIFRLRFPPSVSIATINNCLLYGHSIFLVAAAMLHLNNFDRFLVYCNKFNRQRFDISP